MSLVLNNDDSWKKNRESGPFVDLFTHFIFHKSLKKNYQHSTHLREAGNSEYKENKWHTAMELYNQS